MNKKVILSSILSLILCVSLIAGGTFALFTSESKTNVAINAGKVEVVATIENLTLYSPTMIATDGSLVNADNAATESAFVNGGTAVLKDGVDLVLSNITPGDKVNFQIKLTNNSNVAIKYRTVVRIVNDNGLASGLNMVIGEAYDGSAQYSNWAPMTVAEKTKIIDCSVELPTTAGDEYQDKTCTIVYTVEAIQGNAETDNNVAKVIAADKTETYFVDFGAAIAAVRSNETVEIIRPGTYPAFEIPTSKTNVTVKGFVGTEKSASTVIRTTKTDNIRTYGDGTVLDGLYIDVPVAQSTVWMQAGAISPYYNINSGYAAKDITVKNCRIVGNGSVDFAMLYCSSGLTFDKNTVENFEVGVYVMNDNSAADGFVLTNNTFNNVTDPVNIYWGATADDNVDGLVNITGNTVTGDEPAYITVWDLAQNANKPSAFKNVTISGNNGNILYHLVHFDLVSKTNHTVTFGTGEQSVVYLTKVHSDINKNDMSNYEIKLLDGSDLPTRFGSNTFINSGDNVYLYNIATGTYLLVNKTTGDTMTFKVENPVVGQKQIIELPKVTTVGTKEDLINALNNASAAGAGNSIINITSDINLNGAEWTPFNVDGYNGADIVTVNGNGHTITGLSAPLFAGGFAGGSGIVINDLTIADSTIVSTNNVGAGAFIEYADSMTVVTLNDCHLVSSSVTGSGDARVGALVGYATGYVGAGEVFANVTIENCTVVDCAISGDGSASAIIGHAGANANTATVIKDCAVKNTTITSNEAGSYRVGIVIGTANGGNVTISGITSEGNTVSQPGATTPKVNDFVGRFALNGTGVVTIEGAVVG